MRFGICLAMFAAAVFVGVPSARADVDVTVTITGNLDDIIAVLEQLKRAGIGGSRTGSSREDALQVKMHSISEKGKIPGSILESLQPEAEPKPAPVVALEAVQAEPTSLLAGEKLRISVRAVDEAHLIDTVTAGIPDLGLLADLTDDGTRGDATLGDGVWTAEVTLPANAAPATYAIEIMAYGAYGAPLNRALPNGTQELLRAEASVVVESLPEMPAPEGIQSQYASEDAPAEDAPAEVTEEVPAETPPAPGIE